MSNNVRAGHKQKQSYANSRTTGKEQYYTNSNVVDLCLQEVTKHIDLKDRFVLEPCGGTGEFIKGFQRIGIPDDRIRSYDIEPKHPKVMLGNYLETEIGYKNYISITNPPFGRMSTLAKKFFNHAANHSDYICYLIPKSWRKWSTQNSLDKRFHLIADIDLPKNCFYLPDGQETKKDVLNTVFQIWEKRHLEREKIVIPDNKLVEKIIPTMKLVKDKHGKDVRRPDYVTGVNFEMIVFGHSCGKYKELDPTQKYDAKTTTMYFNIDRQDVKDAIKSIDFSGYYNNVAYVSALSLQEINHALNNHFKLENFKWSKK
jgi:predicted RNA methylase|tara:strand:+ start:320 stop:1264 length:945 start_codon:yes stop_codon:yes gene_type:complete